MEPDLQTSSLLTIPSALALLHPQLSPAEAADSFEENLAFARSVLGSWGLQLGALAYSGENEQTVKAIVELAVGRQREAQLRSRAREDLSALQFERDKLQSFLEQARSAMEENAKRFGRVENENAELKSRLRKDEGRAKREREEDRKALAMMRAKHEHLLHELKKKEQEIARLRDQLKKNSEKTISKNSFEVSQNLLRTSSKDQQQPVDKFAFLLQRNERQLGLAVQENALLKEKVAEIRDSLVEFNRWIDREVFGEEESGREYTDRFFLNHHLLLRKDSLTQQLKALLETTKDGILQLRQLCRGRSHSPRKMENPPALPIPEEGFKRKTSIRQEARPAQSQLAKPKESKTIKMTAALKKMETAHNENQTPRSSHQLQVKEVKSEANSKQAMQKHKLSFTELKKQPSIINLFPHTPRQQEVNLEQELSEGSSHDSSIISHISIERIGRSRHERWSQLFQDEE